MIASFSSASAYRYLVSCTRKDVAFPGEADWFMLGHIDRSFSGTSGEE